MYNKTVEGSDAFGNPNWQTNRFLNSVAEREENIDKQASAVSNVNATLKYDVICLSNEKGKKEEGSYMESSHFFFL